MKVIGSVPTVLSMLALFVALSGTGYAVASGGHSSSQAVIYACVNHRTGALRIARGPKTCRGAGRDRPREQLLEWNHIGPSDGYYSYVATGDDASVTVPPGSYIATGGCTAAVDTRSKTLVFGAAISELATSPFLPPHDFRTGSETQTSVPNAGYNDPFPDEGSSGTASLSNSYGVHLPHGGTIYESCAQSPGLTGLFGSSAPVTFGDLYVTAIRVGTLHQS